MKKREGKARRDDDDDASSPPPPPPPRGKARGRDEGDDEDAAGEGDDEEGPGREERRRRREKREEKKDRDRDEERDRERKPRKERGEDGAPEPVKRGAEEGHQGVQRLLQKVTQLDAFGGRARKVVRALSRLGREGAISLAEALDDARWPVRYSAAAALQRMAVRYDAQDAAEALSRLSHVALEDAEIPVRSMAIEALAALRMQRRAVLPVLVRALGDADADVSRSAVMHIVELSTDAEDTTKRMIKVLEAKKNVFSRIGAMLVLFHLGKQAREAVPHLLQLLNDPATEIREYAHLALLGIRTPSMRLEIVRTASMRLEVVEDELDEASEARPAKKRRPAADDDEGDKAAASDGSSDADEDDEVSDGPAEGEAGDASSLEGERQRRPRRRRGLAGRVRRRLK